MMSTILRGLILFGGVILAFVFIALGIFFLAWVLSRRDTRW